MLGMGHGKQDTVTILEESLVWWVRQTQKQTKFSERWLPDKAHIGQPALSILLLAHAVSSDQKKGVGRMQGAAPTSRTARLQWEDRGGMLCQAVRALGGSVRAGKDSVVRGAGLGLGEHRAAQRTWRGEAVWHTDEGYGEFL